MPQGAADWAEVKRRLDTLEQFHKATVESALEQLQQFIRAPSFSKEKALDYIITLKIVAKECNHPKSGFFDAVLRGMQEKSRVPDYISKQYHRALLGDKDDERVLESMARSKRP